MAMFITLLEASAVANQFKRITVEKDQERLILTEPEDFEEARKCWQYLALYQMKVDAIGLRVLDALPDEEPTGAIDEKGREIRPEPGEKAKSTRLPFLFLISTRSSALHRTCLALPEAIAVPPLPSGVGSGYSPVTV